MLLFEIFFDFFRHFFSFFFRFFERFSTFLNVIEHFFLGLILAVTTACCDLFYMQLLFVVFFHFSTMAQLPLTTKGTGNTKRQL
jgi:hypothetical protein